LKDEVSLEGSYEDWLLLPNLIAPQFNKTNWSLSDRTSVRLEIPVSGYDANPYNGVTDCCLYRDNRDMTEEQNNLCARRKRVLERNF
jgi:hypothetical protein